MTGHRRASTVLRSPDVVRSGIEPQVVTVRTNHRHPVVNSRGHCVRGGRQYRARLHPLPARITPALPQSGKGEQTAVTDLEAEGLLRRATTLPLVKAVRRNEASAQFHRFTEAGKVCAVSDLALIILAAPDVSFAHDGINPHRIVAICGGPSDAAGQPRFVGSARY